MIYCITVVCLTLMAGLFFSWTISVTPGLAKLDGKNYLMAMQSMNRAILNPIFYVVFVGSIVSLPIATSLQYKLGINQRFYYFLIASLFYLIGSVLVTFFGNVPINNQLEILNLDSMSAEEISTFRSSFESRWNRLNLLRTISSLIALILVLIPLIFKSDT